jgi:uncharacterized protein (TIGR02271 family)
MSSTSNIREGMEVYGSDEQLIGTIEGQRGGNLMVNGMSIPGDAVARVARNRVYLRGASSMYMGQSSTRRTGTARAEGEVRVPVAEERLTVGTQEAEVGAVEVRKTVVTEQQSVPVELMREEVHVQERDITDRPAQAGDQLFQEGVIRVPIRGEEAVVQKEAVVTGEVVIDKQQTTERQTVTDTVRKERVEVEENFNRARGDFQQHFAQRQSAATGQRASGQRVRTFEEAEPNYRTGFTAAHDERYAGRTFEEIEPDLRGAHESSSRGSGDTWDTLREEIREGWTRARGR